MTPLSANSKDNKLLGTIEVSHEEGWYQTGVPGRAMNREHKLHLKGFPLGLGCVFFTDNYVPRTHL